ncbi:MAG: hypothetical protein ABIO75_04700 [Thermomonas sp.]
MPRCAVPPLKLLSIAILAVLPALSANAGPQSPPQQESSQQHSQSRDNSTLSDAVRRIERNTRGEVLSAERVQYDGRDMHRVKVVDDAGRVRIFMQDPNPRDDDAGNNRNSKRNTGKDARDPQRRQRPTRGDDD